MIVVARRNLFQEPLRLFLSAVGVALAFTLILLLGGVQQGLNEQVTAYLDNTPLDLLVAQEGVENLLGATSLLPPGTEARVAAVEGVADVVPIVSQFVILDLKGKKVTAYLVGYDPERGGGPWALAAGREPRAGDEVVFDQVLAANQGLQVGDRVDIMGKQFTIVGLSSGTTSWMAGFFFLTQAAAQDLLLMPGATNFLLVSVAPGQSPEVVRDRLAAGVPGIEVLLRETVAANDLKLLVEIFGIVMGMMVAIAFGVGTLIVGMVLYTATMDRRREYGVLKALGARNRHLYLLVTVQALTATGLGLLMGLALTWLAAWAISAAYPQFGIALLPSRIANVALVSLGMALLAALLPARIVARLDPAQVFRGL